MKKNVLFILVIFALFACDPDEGVKIEKVVDTFAGTSWEAVDDIAELIFGKPATTTIEFLGDGVCQTINVKPGLSYGISTSIIDGTYTFDGDSVFWTENKHNFAALRVGSVLRSDMGTISGDKRVYIKK